MYRHPRTASLLPVLLLALTALPAASGCTNLSLKNGLSGVIQPRIVPSVAQQGFDVVERGFLFEESEVRLRVPVDRAVYAGSVGARKSAIFLGDAEASDWVPDYYRAFVGESHQDGFYDTLLEALHDVRRREDLDSSRYVELVTSMVQGMEYRTDPGDLAPKFPIETFVDGYGDCDDKALLAAALLSRDGFDVAILLFSPEKHVALGVRASRLDYKGTGYAYVEVTSPSFVGIPAEQLSDGVRLTSQPEVIRVGSGTDAFTADAQVEFIRHKLEDMRAAEKRMRDEIEAQSADLAKEQTSLEEARQALQGIGDPQTLADAVRRYNERVQAANDLAERVNQRVSVYNALVDAERYAADNQTARPQVYERLRALRY